MKKLILGLSLFLIANATYAEESKKTEWKTEVKTEYNLTDDQVKYLEDKGLTGNDAVRIANFSKSSGKTIEEVSAMRLDQKMGWGRIANELGVHPSEIGHSVSDMHKADKADKSDKGDKGDKIDRANARGDKGGGGRGKNK